MVDARDVVIWSADVETRNELLYRLVGVGPGGLRYVKLDRLGLTRMGLDVIEEVTERGFQVFADAKIVEIPDKVIEVAQLHLRHRPWMLNVMAGVCSSGLMVSDDPKQVDALKRFADACLAVGTLPCAVTVLTSKTEDTVSREFNGASPDDQVWEYATMLVEAGFTDMVCSPNEAVTIREESQFDTLKLNTPGIRMPGSGADDQARIDTPAGALRSGANRLVIGRDLTKGYLNVNFAQIAAHLKEEGVVS